MTLSPEVVDMLKCPRCKGPLEHRVAPAERLACHVCRLAFAVEDDIPILLLDEAQTF